MQIPDTDTSEYAALIEMAATGGRARDPRIAPFAAVMTPRFWGRSPEHSAGKSPARNDRQQAFYPN
ncbi:MULTISPECIES: hypothetical protein [unclassified Variovorax]|jgi:hypothetical protein|uniref:hypothetical protein n=1 Tax=unclassified Variovorax TaxID=663243 RepID=UPI002B23E93A|nr:MULTISPECIES: hypothetical protein [unclassified Variovorax]MEB0058990.1 hypothetical protein [Variovorax sp. LG9.2]MEB0113798.1 hypothetical protein [Variovorax sp. RTB1]